LGGFNSTRWNKHKPAPLVEHSLRIDLLDAGLRSALAQPGEAVASITFSTGGQVQSQWVLCFSAAAEDGGRDLVVFPADNVSKEAAQHFPLRPVRVGFHERLYPMCPRCERTTRILFALPRKGRFACKRCIGLTYQSEREHDARLDRIIRAVKTGDEAELDRLEAALNGSGYRALVASQLLLSALFKLRPVK